MIGKTVSHYKILEKLGEGGMGVVYKAEDTKLKRTVALKFLPPGLTRDPQAKERFLHEAQAAAALEHQNICNIYEIDETEDQIFIVMSFVDGQNLKEKIVPGPLKIDETLKIAIQAAEGLQAAHEKGIIHRDIKSANIMVTEKGQTKIMDFGLAKLKGQTIITKEGTTLGTAAYMSPEQSQGADVDHRTDIWSLGVVLYEMITGQLPFKGEYEQAVTYSIMNEEPEPPTALRTGVPMELERFINKALAKDPSERYQHADDMVVDLKKLKKDTKPEVTPSKIKTSPEITIKASRKTMILGIIILAAAVAAGYLFLYVEPRKRESASDTISQNRTKNSIAVMYFENNTGDKSLDHWRKMFSDLLITDLAQSRYLRVLSGDKLFSILIQLNQLDAKTYSSEILNEVANRGGVNYILQGKYARMGETFRIDILLKEANTGELINSLRVEAKGEEKIFTKVDELTKKIKLNFNLTQKQITNDIDKEIETITTSSPEAYKYYSEGDKYGFNGEFLKNIKFLEKAVAVDPEFAAAYRVMSVCFGNLGFESESKKYIQKAVDLIDRVSIRERHQILGTFYSMSEKTYEKAIEEYKKLLHLYPDDWVGNNNLGVLYDSLELYDEAIERFEVIRQNKYDTFLSYDNLARAYITRGLRKKAREAIEDYINNFSDNAFTHQMLAFNYIVQGKFELALREVEIAFSLNPSDVYNFSTKGDIHYFRGDFAKAEREYQNILGSEEQSFHDMGRLNLAALFALQGQFEDAKNQYKQGIKLAKEIGSKSIESTFHFYLARMNLLSGDFEDSLKELDEAWSCAAGIYSMQLTGPSTQVFTLCAKGHTYLEMKSKNSAKKTANELKEFLKKRVKKKLIRFYYHLFGMIELKSSNFPRSIEYFKKALSSLPSQFSKDNFHALFLDPLALAYFKSRDLENAQKEYERITSLTLGRYFYGDIYARAFFKLGQIYQQKGWKGKAIESYNKFINLWKNCDPQFQPLVKDAGKRIKELESSK